MGQLARGETTWEVYVEFEFPPDDGTVRGRIHFVHGDRHRQSAWVFLERTQKEVQERFNDFSANELWNLVEALVP
jgi:hypothetical protein